MYNKKQVWEKISLDLAKHGIQKAATKCDEKWRNLKNNYEKVLKEKQRTGNRPQSWKYFDMLHDIYFRSPQFNPVCVVSSTGLVKMQQSKEQSASCSYESEENGLELDIIATPKRKELEAGRSVLSPEGSSGNGCKRRNCKSMIVLALDIEKNKQKRHEERMEQKERMFKWFQDHVMNKNYRQTD